MSNALGLVKSQQRLVEPWKGSQLCRIAPPKRELLLFQTAASPSIVGIMVADLEVVTRA